MQVASSRSCYSLRAIPQAVWQCRLQAVNKRANDGLPVMHQAVEDCHLLRSNHQQRVSLCSPQHWSTAVFTVQVTEPAQPRGFGHSQVCASRSQSRRLHSSGGVLVASHFSVTKLAAGLAHSGSKLDAPYRALRTIEAVPVAAVQAQQCQMRLTRGTSHDSFERDGSPCHCSPIYMMTPTLCKHLHMVTSGTRQL